jgi:hypothetical protein
MSEPKHDSGASLRLSLGMIFCYISWAVVLVTAFAWYHAPGPKLLEVDRLALQDFARRLTAQHTLLTITIWGGSAGLLISGLLIGRRRSRQ